MSTTLLCLALPRHGAEGRPAASRRRVYDLTSYFRDTGGDAVTLPQHFAEQGYTSVMRLMPSSICHGVVCSEYEYACPKLSPFAEYDPKARPVIKVPPDVLRKVLRVATRPTCSTSRST